MEVPVAEQQEDMRVLLESDATLSIKELIVVPHSLYNDDEKEKSSHRR